MAKRGSEGRRAFKERLLAAGEWDNFKGQREALCSSEQISGPEARERLLPEFSDEAIAERQGRPVEEVGGVKAEEPKPKKRRPRKKAAAGAIDDLLAGEPGEKMCGVGIRLVDAKWYADKPKSSLRTDVEWVFKYLGVANVRLRDAPSAGAAILLQVVRMNLGAMKSFIEGVAMKLLPSRQQIEAEDERRDSGQDCIKTIERLLCEDVDSGEDALLPADGTEGVPGEPSVAPEGDTDGSA